MPSDLFEAADEIDYVASNVVDLSRILGKCLNLHTIYRDLIAANVMAIEFQFMGALQHSVDT